MYNENMIKISYLSKCLKKNVLLNKVAYKGEY